MFSLSNFNIRWQELKAKNSLKLHLFLLGIIIASFTISFFQIKSLTQIKTEAQDTQNIASPKEAQFISNEVLIKVKKEVKNKVKENHEDTGLESLNKIFKEHKAKKFERVAKEGKNSKKDSDIFFWYKVSFEGKGETIQGSFDKKTKNLNLKNPSIELSLLYAKVLNDPSVEEIEPNYIVNLEQAYATVTISQPNGGEFWQKGSIYKIEWSAINISGQDKTTLSLWNWQTQSQIATIATDAISNPGTNYFNWTIPTTLEDSSNYRIGVQIETQYQTPGGGWTYPKDYSDQNFSILTTVPSLTPTPTLTPTNTPTVIPTVELTSTPTSSPTPTIVTNIPNDPYYSSQGTWGQTYSDMWGLKKINMEDAWSQTTGSPSIIVADIDTGVDRDHEDIKDNMWVNPNETQSNGVDDDGNGFIDDYYGWDFVNNDNDPMDDHGHGTHTAGTIAAVGNNGIGIVGVNWTSKILPVKFLSSGGSGTLDNGARALIYAADMGAKVSSNSWGCSCQSTIVDDAINYEHNKGMVIAVAAGNSNIDALDFSPASSDKAVTVAALDYTDSKAYFSNWGEKIDIAAPGVDVLSLKSSVSPMCDASRTVGTNYCRVSGTSMATPHAAGLAALLFAKDLALTNEQVRQIIRASADDLGNAGKDSQFGYGRINSSQSLISSNSKPLAPIITSPSSRGIISGSSQFLGSADGLGFSSFKIEAGLGRSPSSWSLISDSNTPVSNSALATVDTAKFSDGKYIFRLTATDSSGKDYSFQIGDVEVDNFDAQIDSPIFEVSKGAINISGSADAKNGLSFSNYTLEWGIGTNPSDYSSLGISLTNNGMRSVTIGSLGTWDTSSLSPGQQYTLRLTVRATNSTSSQVATSVFLDADLVGGWPKAISRKNCPTNEVCEATSTFSDLDGDGIKEVIIPSGDQINVFRKDGSNFPNFPVTIGTGEFMIWPANVADLDNDGKKEIIVGATINWQKKIYIVKSDGTFYPGWKNPIFSVYGMGSSINSTPTVANIDNDSLYEVLILDPQWDKRLLHAYHPDGTEASGFPKEVNVINDVPSAISAMDMDRDGQVELTYSSYNQVYLFDNKGNLLPGWPQTIPQIDGRTYRVTSPATFADIDGDSQFEVFVVTESWVGLPGYIYGWRKSGSLINGFPQATGSISSSPGSLYSASAVDLDNDGKEEVVVGASPISIHTINGKKIITNFASRFNPALSDINGDGKYKIAGGSGYYIGFINDDGTLFWRIPATSYTRVFWDPITVADMDNNGKMEFAAVQGASLGSEEDMIAYLWEFPGLGKANLEWPMFMQNPSQSGRLEVAVLTPSPTPADTPTPTNTLTPTNTPTPSPSPSPTPPDTTAPIVSITNPLNGEKVSGTIDVLANATDNGGIVTKVEFLIDNVLKIVDTVPPYGFSFDTDTVLNGIHSISVKGYDPEGNIGTDTISVNVENGDKIPPSSPTNLLAVPVSHNQVNLTWNPSTDNVGVAGYWIIRDGITIASSSTANYSDLTVNASTSYTYQVVAYDADSNNSPLSNSVIITTPAAPDTTPPSPPSNLSARAASSTQVNLSWTASTDNVGVAGYDIYRNNTKVASINSTSYGDTGLTPSTAYNYYVIALDISGNQSVNSNYAGTTTFPPPNATGNITGTVSNQSGTPIAGAKVTGIVNGSKRTYTTNTQGIYFISNLTPGLTYNFTFSASAYTSQKIYITTIAEQTVVRDVILVKSSGKK